MKQAAIHAAAAEALRLKLAAVDEEELSADYEVVNVLDHARRPTAPPRSWDCCARRRFCARRRGREGTAAGGWQVHNPGLREAIKEFSQWPTIPQLYIGGAQRGGAWGRDLCRRRGQHTTAAWAHARAPLAGEFIGGSDIVADLHAKGELATRIANAAAATK